MLVMPMQPGFELLEHTADAGVLATGRDLKEAFANAARGMFTIITDLEDVAPAEGREVSASAGEIEGLLVEWLSQLLYIFEVENFLFSQFDITHLDSTSISSTAYGEPVDPSRHTMKTGVKAVTYHLLQVSEEDGCSVRVIFDI